MTDKEIPAYKSISIDLLIPYATNSRTHSDEQINQIAASIREFGFINPIIADGSNRIIAGHGRLLAAKKLGLSKVPVLEVDHLTDAQRKAYVIVDNQLALNADWDHDLLKIEIDALGSLNFDVDLLGFDSLDSVVNSDVSAHDFSESVGEIFEVVVECINETEQEAVYEMIKSKGYKCRVLSM